MNWRERKTILWRKENVNECDVQRAPNVRYDRHMKSNDDVQIGKWDCDTSNRVGNDNGAS